MLCFQYREINLSSTNCFILYVLGHTMVLRLLVWGTMQMQRVLKQISDDLIQSVIVDFSVIHNVRCISILFHLAVDKLF